MDPARKRTIRLVVALSGALLLAGALVYTSFTASTEAKARASCSAAAEPAVLRADRQGRAGLDRAARARPTSSGCATATGHVSVPVRYTGAVPDPFREGREVIVDVRKQGADVRRREGLAGHEVPVEVHGRAAEHLSLTC